MEQLLRGGEIPAVEKHAAPDPDAFPAGDPVPGPAICPGTEYDLASPILYFPVRHHSPVCAFHLKKAIEAYGPDCILVEGPENAAGLIPVLVHPETKAPAALYYSYKDKEGIVSREKGEYKCYYPFLDCSAELVALREPAERNIPAAFIDLPYREILAAAEENRGVRKEGEKQTYNDDYLLSRSRYLGLLCERAGLRDFEEFWEKYFEMQGLLEDTPRFVHQMLTYCGLSRLHTPRQELEAEGCLLRERYMAERIAAFAGQYKKILAVTGGFHTYGLGELLKKRTDGGLDFLGEPVRLHRGDESLQSVYPMAYSMEAADALNGYASGMQSPGFYQQVWRRLEDGMEPGTAYDGAVLHFLAAAGRRARGKDESISVYDEICALSMARGLASLRGKKSPGLYELRDSALSSFVKGECSLSTDGPLRILSRLTTGEQTGAVCADAARPPLLADFEKQCEAFGLKIHSTAEQECTLAVFSKEKHLRLARFFYQTEFLGCGFAKKKKGSDLVNRRDPNRIREIWIYRWSAQVTAALIDASVSGGTVEEAVRSHLAARFSQCGGSREGAKLLVQSFLMGLFDEQERMGAQFAGILAGDGDFFSLSGGFSYLVMLGELADLYQVRDRMNLEKMIGTCFEKILQLLSFMGNTGEEGQDECMECLRSLYQATGKEAYAGLRPVFAGALERMLEKRPINPAIEGAALGILYGCGGQESIAGRIQDTARGYIQGTEEARAGSAAFLRGLFFTARDFVFVSREFIGLIDGLLARLSPEEFMGILPQLRLAFSYFTPMETDRIAGRAAGLHGAAGRDLLRRRAVSPEEYAYGQALDAYVERRRQAGMESWEEGESG